MTQQLQHRDILPARPVIDPARRRQLDNLRDQAADYEAQLWLMQHDPTLAAHAELELHQERARVIRVIAAIKAELGR